MDVGARARFLAASVALLASLGCNHHRQKTVPSPPGGFQRMPAMTACPGDCGCNSCTAMPPAGATIVAPPEAAIPGVPFGTPATPSHGVPSQPYDDLGPSGHPPDALPHPLNLPDTRSQKGPLKPNTPQSGVLPDSPPESSPNKRSGPVLTPMP